MTAPIVKSELYTGTHKPTKCPVCGTFYELADEYVAVECGGEGRCPARKAGARPSPDHVLCACNQSWLKDGPELVMIPTQEGEHGFEDCWV